MVALFSGLTVFPEHMRQNLDRSGGLIMSEALMLELGKQIPEAEFVVPEGGYFLWLDLDEGTDTTKMLATAKAEGVAFVAGPDFMLEGGERSLRLSFAPVPPGDMADGVGRLARALAATR